MTALTWARLHYRGDLRGRIEGQVVGPNLMREVFAVDSTDYDARTDTTTAHLRYATTHDVKASLGLP